MGLILYIIAALDLFILSYLLLFFVINVSFVAISWVHIRRELRKEQLRPAAACGDASFLPSVTLLVPAYNEEVTIAESIKSLLRLRYPAFEIVICNDGSKDRTVEVLRREFQLVRTEMDYNSHLQTSNIRAFYEARCELPPGLRRLVLIDKENGGKADALNAAINISQCDFVTSMDADSLLAPDTLLRAVQPIVADPGRVVAVGGQVGISNGSRVEGGRVAEMRLPKAWIARFQIIEYMRSFAQGRVALGALNALLILSGVFALMRRDLVVAVGGFLTRHMRSRIGVEYCGTGAHTVCEDMEIVVRLHRYLLDKRLSGRIATLAWPVAWTECPENYKDLGKQRARWYRGLLEVLNYHRGIMLRPRFRQIGMFSLPYQLLFEAIAPELEFLGYLLLPVCAGFGLLSLRALVAFIGFALAVNLCLSTLSALLCVYTEHGLRARVQGLSLFPISRVRDVLVLLLAGFLSSFGYRQYLVLWQLRGFRDFAKGKKGWDKFARKGFQTKPA